MTFDDDMKLINAARNEMSATKLNDRPEEAPPSDRESSLNVMAINANTTREAWATRRQLLTMPCAEEVN